MCPDCDRDGLYSQSAAVDTNILHFDFSFMPAVCFYFQVHQPMRIKRYRIFDIGRDHEYFNNRDEHSLNNRYVLERVARKCYLPTNALFLELLKKHSEFKVSFSLSGVILEQLEEHAPEVIASFQRLADTGRVEVLAET